METLAGVSFADPYRWLEDESDEVRAWQAAQARLASDSVRVWPHFARVRDSVERYSGGAKPPLPREAGGRWFRIASAESGAHKVALVSETPMGEGRVIFDPASENADNPPFLSWISPSPNGQILALGLCADGSEHNHIRLVDVETGHLLDAPTQMLMDAWLGGAHWLIDSSGFFFTALEGPAETMQLEVFRHDVGYATRRIDIPAAIESKDYRVAIPSRDGRWVVLSQRITNAVPTAILDLQDEEAGWRPFVRGIDGTIAGYVIEGNYIAVTDIGAARSRVVAIPLNTVTAGDPATWREVVPESDAVIRAIRIVGDSLYVSELVDCYARVRIFSFDGLLLGMVPLPARGAIAEPDFPLMQLCAPTDQVDYLFSFSSLTASWSTYRYHAEQVELEALTVPAICLEDAHVEDRWATSADGTRIPYHIVDRPRGRAGEARPALLYAYGGFNYPLNPQFPGPMAAFIEAGGQFVHCHIRGGSEFGRDWWDGGRLKNKQKCYQDLYAIAEDLIADGRSRPDLLAMVGESNGGLMAGVAAIQRPDLWGAVVPRVPLTDIMGACRTAYGRLAVCADYGDPEDAVEVERMALFSPYQMARDGIHYPAVYVDAGDSDPRCPPWHARKFVARLQAAQTGGAPVLLHVWEGAGHGGATAEDVVVEEHAEWLAFVMQRLGMTP